MIKRHKKALPVSVLVGLSFVLSSCVWLLTANGQINSHSVFIVITAFCLLIVGLVFLSFPLPKSKSSQMKRRHFRRSLYAIRWNLQNLMASNREGLSEHQFKFLERSYRANEEMIDLVSNQKRSQSQLLNAARTYFIQNPNK